MPSLMSLEKELALIDIGYACFKIQKFRGQEEEFTGWLPKVERVSLLVSLMTKRSSKWLFQDLEVMHFNGGRITRFREEIKEKRR